MTGFWMNGEKKYIVTKKYNAGHIRQFPAFRFGKMLFLVENSYCDGYGGHWYPRSKAFQLRRESNHATL